jgi:hypothetical protein
VGFALEVIDHTFNWSLQPTLPVYVGRAITKNKIHSTQISVEHNTRLTSLQSLGLGCCNSFRSDEEIGLISEDLRRTLLKWVYEAADPVGDAILEIRKGLQQINPEAAEEFIRLYLGGGSIEDEG